MPRRAFARRDGGPVRWCRSDVEIDERPVLLAARHIRITGTAGNELARKRHLDRPAGWVMKHLDVLGRYVVPPCDRLRGDGVALADPLICRGIVEEHVNGQLKRPGVLAADQARQFVKLCHGPTSS